jgi:ribosomal protein S18 acetylase RimI-like enzyme
MACEGLLEYVWSKMAEPGESPWDIGQQSARHESGSSSYRNAVLREHEGLVASALLGYPLGEQPGAVNYDQTSETYVPLKELMDLVPNTWYIDILATFPQYRGRGHGTGLLSIAEQLAKDTQRVGMSLIVSDANEGAVRLYERRGYDAIATRRMVKESWRNPGNSWVLLQKEF